MKNKILTNSNRRDFLKKSAVTVAGFAASGLTLAPVRKAHGAVLNISIDAEPFSRALIDTTFVPCWRFNDQTNTAPGSLSSALMLFEGDEVNLTVTNNLAPANGGRPINLVIPGVPGMENTAAIDPGNNDTYSFTAPAAGSYVFYDNLGGDELGRAMGLIGPMVVTAPLSPDNLFAGGPAFDRQYTLVLNELDDRLNLAVDANMAFDMATYEPNYFFLNGKSAPATLSDPDTEIVMEVGEDVALRFINPGLIASPMHPHGFHVNVATRDRLVETSVVAKDVILVKPGECVDVILPCDQPGTFPLHSHYLPATQANGIYVNPFGGALTNLRAIAA